MRYIIGDILDQKGIICHQVNCKKVAGAGLAKQIRERYQNWYEEFRKAQPRIGTVSDFFAGDQIIFNLYAQDGFGRDKRYTDYEALRKCFSWVTRYNEYQKLPIHVPYKIGCGLAGGDWNVVLKIIEEELPDAIIVVHHNIPIMKIESVCDDMKIDIWRDGEQCSHKGCRSHISHPCEGCGRFGANGIAIKGFSESKFLTPETRITKEKP